MLDICSCLPRILYCLHWMNLVGPGSGIGAWYSFFFFFTTTYQFDSKRQYFLSQFTFILYCFILIAYTCISMQITKFILTHPKPIVHFPFLLAPIAKRSITCGDCALHNLSFQFSLSPEQRAHSFTEEANWGSFQPGTLQVTHVTSVFFLKKGIANLANLWQQIIFQLSTVHRLSYF